MRGVSSRTGWVAALSRHQPIRLTGKHRPRPPGMLAHRARGVAAPAVAGRAAVCLATAAAAILIGASAAPANVDGQGWSITPSPNPRVPTGQLFWVSCPAANSCMAVGTYVKASGIGVNLAERWNGTSWRILPTPNPSGIAFSGLLGVACTAPSACTAVGATTKLRSGGTAPPGPSSPPPARRAAAPLTACRAFQPRRAQLSEAPPQGLSPNGGTAPAGASSPPPTPRKAATS